MLTEPTATEAPLEEKQLTITYQHGTAKKNRPEDCVTDAGLRFSDDIPVEIIHITPQEIELLRPIVEAQLAHVLSSKVLAMDETPIKASRDEKGKMITGYLRQRSRSGFHA